MWLDPDIILVFSRDKEYINMLEFWKPIMVNLCILILLFPANEMLMKFEYCIKLSRKIIKDKVYIDETYACRQFQRIQ